MKLVYSDQYDLNLGDHVFPSIKYRLTKEKLLRDGVVRPEDFVEPSPASDEDVALVHHREYIRKLQTGKLSHLEILRLEIPYSPELIRAVWLCAGGSILAGRLALAGNIAVNVGGGFHHAFPDHGEGFCVLNDVGVAIRALRRDRLIRRAAVVDLVESDRAAARVIEQNIVAVFGEDGQGGENAENAENATGLAAPLVLAPLVLAALDMAAGWPGIAEVDVATPAGTLALVDKAA